MRLAHIKIGLFALFLAAPVLALLLLGSVGEYGSVDPKFPRLWETLRGKKHRMDQFGEAVLHRSAVSKLSIELHNWVAYRLVGFVDTTRVVSGQGDWLFYRPEFQGGRCLEREKAAADLRQLAVLIDLGRASGIDLFVSISPDKSTIYPEMLSAAARGYWRCRVESTTAFRQLIKQEAPALIDHAEPLLAEKALHPERQLYYVTDTHWTPYGGAVAVRQLLAAIHPAEQIPAPRRSATASRATDLSRMLLLPASETVDDVDPASWSRPQGDADNLRTAIVHDSFYNAIAPQLAVAFPNAALVGFNDAHAADADRLIINSVERSLSKRVREGPLAWNARLPAAIVQRNLKRARDCASFAPVSQPGVIGLAGASSGTIVPIPAISGGRLPCLRLAVTAKQGATLNVALPNGTTGAFEPGRSFKYKMAPDDETIAFVLPAYVAGSSVRLQASEGEIGLSLVETGDIAQPRLASAAP